VVSPNGDAGVLEDQRQEAIEQLSQLVGLDQISTSANGIDLTTSNGGALVSGSSSYPLSTPSRVAVSEGSLANAVSALKNPSTEVPIWVRLEEAEVELMPKTF
jgi:flagellar hook-associated protein FlgK